jgi:hypothetical protein
MSLQRTGWEEHNVAEVVVRRATELAGEDVDDIG